MTTLATTLTALAAAAAAAFGGAAGADSGDPSPSRTALVVDAAEGRDGRELVDPRLRDIDADVRLPRTDTEARTNLRYFESLGHRIVVVGSSSQAAAKATRVDALPAEELDEGIALAGRR
jgi:hypothetical protein